jgi:hypothetical protein
MNVILEDINHESNRRILYYKLWVGKLQQKWTGITKTMKIEWTIAGYMGLWQHPGKFA